MTERKTPEEKLICEAMQARENAYAPYSNFQVGAALLDEEGKVYTGCNVENAAYTPCNCAERTAVFKGVSEGKRRFQKIAVVGGRKGKELDFCPPCGVCRQVLREFAEEDTFEVIVAKSETEYKKYTLRELLPQSFGPEQLGK